MGLVGRALSWAKGLLKPTPKAPKKRVVQLEPRGPAAPAPRTGRPRWRKGGWGWRQNAMKLGEDYARRHPRRRILDHVATGSYTQAEIVRRRKQAEST